MKTILAHYKNNTVNEIVIWGLNNGGSGTASKLSDRGIDFFNKGFEYLPKLTRKGNIPTEDFSKNLKIHYPKYALCYDIDLNNCEQRNRNNLNGPDDPQFCAICSDNGEVCELCKQPTDYIRNGYGCWYGGSSREADKIGEGCDWQCYIQTHPWKDESNNSVDFKNYFTKVPGGYVYKQTFMDYLKNIFKHNYVISEMNKLKDGKPQIKQTEIMLEFYYNHFSKFQIKRGS